MRITPSRSAIALGLAGLLGAVLGYLGEASAREPSDMNGHAGGIAISGGSNAAGRFIDGGFSVETRSSDRRERRADDGFGHSERRSGSFARPDDGRSYWDLDAPDMVRTERGSFVSLYRRDGGLARNRAYDGLEILEDDGDGDGGGSVAYFGAPASYGGGGASLSAPGAFPSEPKIIDIETERLDRRPIGPSGIEITYTGGAKIIRIAPDYGRKDRREAAASSSDGLRSSVSLGGHAPWTEGWLRDCTRSHASFDPDYGTYEGTDGRTTFCTGE